VAELALADITVKLEKKEAGFVPPTKKKDKGIGEFFREFEKYSGTNHRPNTVRRYQAIVDNFKAFLNLQVGITRLSQLSPKVFEVYKTYKRQAPVTGNGRKARKGSKPARIGAKPRTINMEIQTLRTIFGLAVKWGYLDKNPVAGVRRLKVKAPKGPLFLTQDQVSQLLVRSSGQFLDILMMFLHSGLRKGELLNLTWEDIDLERNVVIVQAKEFWEPKTGEREIPMSAKLRELLLRVKAETSNGSQFVFHGKDGEQLRTKLRRRFMALTKACGFPEVTKLHTLRHTFASHLVMSGVDISTVKDLLGHTRIETTMIYAHLTPEHRQKAVNLLDYSGTS